MRIYCTGWLWGSRTWVGLTMILVIPLSAWLCLGRWDFGRIGWSTGQGGAGWHNILCRPASVSTYGLHPWASKEALGAAQIQNPLGLGVILYQLTWVHICFYAVPGEDLNVAVPRARAGDILHRPVRLWAVPGTDSARAVEKERRLTIADELIAALILIYFWCFLKIIIIIRMAVCTPSMDFDDIDIRRHVKVDY